MAPTTRAEDNNGIRTLQRIGGLRPATCVNINFNAGDALQAAFYEHTACFVFMLKNTMTWGASDQDNAFGIRLEICR